jgi:hypothetical protein
LGFKSRLDSLEKAAADEAEAADDYELQMATGSSASSWERAPVRVTGWFSAAGVLPWTGVSLNSSDDLPARYQRTCTSGVGGVSHCMLLFWHLS